MCPIAVIATVCCFFLHSSALSVPYITDHEFSMQKQSPTGIGVLLVHEKDLNSVVNKTIQALSKAAENLKVHGTKVGILNCRQSKAEECQETGIENSVLLYKNGEFITNLHVDVIATQSEAEGQILQWLNWDKVEQLKSINDWEILIEECIGKCNILFAYFKRFGSKAHSNFVRGAVSFDGSVRFVYTTDEDLASRLATNYFNSDKELNDGVDIWAMHCSVGRVGEGCIVRVYFNALKSDLIVEIAADVNSPKATVVSRDEPVAELAKLTANAHRDNLHVLLFLAGSGKLERATSLARKSCSLLWESCRCIVVDQAKAVADSKLIAKGRINLSIVSFGTVSGDVTKPGFLLSETVGEIEEYWKRFNNVFMLQNEASDADNSDPAHEADASDADKSDPVEEEEEERVETLEEISDDAVAFSVHKSKAIHDLYLYDFKTITRLTDVTYEQLIASDKFAVILFTLEFNAKALAALSMVVDIHKRIESDSPFYRVECFDWPDVCDKAGVITYPRMFFYLRDGDRVPIEYKGLWEESEITRAVIIYEQPMPIVMNSLEEIEELLILIPIIFGVAPSTKGFEVFTEASERLSRGKTMFVLSSKERTKAFASELGLKDWNQKDVVVSFTDSGVRSAAFQTVEDVERFIESLQERIWITPSNYEKLLSQKKPVLIQYVNSSSDCKWRSEQQQLSRVLEAIGSRPDYSSRVILAGMDSAPGSAGEYALHMHSGGRQLNVPLAFFNKKENVVSAVSFQEDLTESAVVSWLDNCLQGKEAISYELRKHDWKGRMPGYDFLLDIKKAGMGSNEGKVNDQDEETTISSRFRDRGSSKKSRPSPAKKPNTDDLHRHTEL